MSNRTEEVRAVVEGYFDAIQGVDEAAIDRALEFMADDVVWINPNAIKQEGKYVGKLEIRQLLMSAIPEVYEPGSFENLGRRTLVEGETAVTLYDARSRTAAGQVYEQHYVIEFEVRGDKITYVRENFDTLLFHNLIYGQG